MILFLLFSLVAWAEDFGFHAMEDGEIRLREECLPQSAKDHIKAEGKNVSIKRMYYSTGGKEELIFETRYIPLPQGKEITLSCDLEGLQAYFDGKLYQLSNTLYFNYVVSQKDDCGYSVPRVDVTFQNNPLVETFLLGPDFAVLKGSARKKAEKNFKAAKGIEWSFGYVRGYFSRKGDKGTSYLVFDETEMGTKLVLYRLRGKEKNAEKVDGAQFEPCGS